MEYSLPLRNKDGKIVGYSKVDQDDYEKFKVGFWHLTRGYASGKFGKEKGLLHRFIMNAQKGDPVIDHINHDKLDNRKLNLRYVTKKQNSQNKSKTKIATSNYIGVSKITNSDKWLCSVNHDGKHITHRFEIEEHAAYCYDLLALIYYGPDAQINGLEEPEDFEMPTKKEQVHKGVYKTKTDKFVVVVWHENKTKNCGTYETKEEAIEVYNQKIQEIEESKNEEPLPEIIRNKDGQAIIETFNKNGNKVSECIVDDDKYYELIKYKWFTSLGYIKTHMNNTTVFIHRYLIDPEKGEIVDHVNNNPLDNRISNLRICDDSLNSHNRQIKEGKYRGVSKNGKGYAGKIIKNGKEYNLGTYKTQEEAALAYNTKALELYGEHANLNLL